MEWIDACKNPPEANPQCPEDNEHWSDIMLVVEEHGAFRTMEFACYDTERKEWRIGYTPRWSRDVTHYMSLPDFPPEGDE